VPLKLGAKFFLDGTVIPKFKDTWMAVMEQGEPADALAGAGQSHGTGIAAKHPLADCFRFVLSISDAALL